MLQQVVSLTSQNQITVPVKMISEWEKKPSKVVVSKVGDEIRIKPVPNFWSLAGIFSDSAIKDKSIDEVIELENKAVENFGVERYKKFLKNNK